jgi:hypothetical protein
MSMSWKKKQLFAKTQIEQPITVAQQNETDLERKRKTERERASEREREIREIESKEQKREK